MANVDIASLRASLGTGMLGDRAQQWAAALDELEVKWRCFHCGFEARTAEDALAHFGERDDADEFKPLCSWWRRMTPDERGEVLQDALRELNDEREQNGRLQSENEGLEFRLGEFESLVGSRFKGCKNLNDAFNLYDSMEGRAFASEERAERQEKELEALRKDKARLEEELAREKASMEDGPNPPASRGWRRVRLDAWEKKAFAAEAELEALRKGVNQSASVLERQYVLVRKFIDENVPDWVRGDDAPIYWALQLAQQLKALAALPEVPAR